MAVCAAARFRAPPRGNGISSFLDSYTARRLDLPLFHIACSLKVPPFFVPAESRIIIDDQNKTNTDRALRFSLTLQIIRCIVLALLLTGTAWVGASYLFDWIGP
jgi:hypothetical protein